jgi:tRNA A-37 threonylcarbamoyl transferase component Bud32
MQQTLPRPTNLKHDGFHWYVAPAFQNLLFGPAGFRLAEWLAAGQATIIKQGPHRVVYRVELPDLTFYVKHNLIGDMRTWLRQLIRPSKARKEYRKALAVAERGVPTVEPLALAENSDCFGARESILLTRSLDNTTQLNHFLENDLPAIPQPLRARVQHELARSLGRFIAGLHDSGILHNDMHCGNLLIKLDANDCQPQFYLIDLPSVRLSQTLDWPRSRANLVMLNRWLLLFANRTDRLRFWKAYSAARVSAPWNRDLMDLARPYWPKHPMFRDLAKQLETATRDSNERFWRRRERRCFQRNRHFSPIHHAGLRGFAVTDLDKNDLQRLLSSPDLPFDDPDGRILKSSRSSAVVEEEVRIKGELRKVIFKRFSITSWYDPWLSLLRPTPAIRSWLFGHSLRERSLATPRPLAVFHRMHGGLRCEAYLLMEKVEESIELKAFFQRILTRNHTERQRAIRHWVEQVAITIRELHNRNLAHRDLKAANLLVAAEEGIASGNPAENQHRLWIIDLVGVKWQKQVSQATRVKNLARLHTSFAQEQSLSRTDKLRFLRVYLQWGLLGKQTWKSWWRAIALATRLKIEKNLRSGRPLS